MKVNQLAKTTNVLSAIALIEELLCREKSEQRGLALIYGQTGLGKTTFVERYGFSHGWLYLKIMEQDTSRSMLERIYQRLKRTYYGEELVTYKPAYKLEQEIIEILNTYPQTVIIIDEVNLLTKAKRWRMLETIRDLVDCSFVSIIMVGEERTKSDLENYNRHFFDRCRFFFEFKPNMAEDYQEYFKAVSAGIEIDNKLGEWLYRSTAGNLRKGWKMLEKLEKVALQKKLTRLSLTDLSGDIQ